LKIIGRPSGKPLITNALIDSGLPVERV